MRIPTLGEAPVDFAACREVPFAREVVWHWMLHHPVELLAFDPLHARVEQPTVPLEVGTRFVIHHEFPLRYRQRRVARVNAVRPFDLGFSELADEGAGIDWFPHSIHFRLLETSPGRCLLRLRVRGRFRMPGARYWFVPWFQVIGPYRMERGLETLAESLAAALRRLQARAVPRSRGASAA